MGSIAKAGRSSRESKVPWAHVAHPLQPSSADPGDIDHAVAFAPDRLHVAWGVGESWQEIEISEAVANTSPCPSACPCTETCFDGVGGHGFDRFSLARASESELWLAWTMFFDNSTFGQFEDSKLGECVCQVDEQLFAEPTSTLFLTRIDTSDGSYENVLILPLQDSIVDLEVRAYERRLALTMQVAGEDSLLRVIGLDLDAL
jgi:hypothetical protein